MDMNELFGDYQNGNYSSQNASTVQDNIKNTKTKPPKKKGGAGKIILFLLLLIIIGGAGFYVYAFTDMLKTPKQLVAKYVVQTINDYSNITPLSNKIAAKTTGTATVNGELTVCLNEATEGEMQDVTVDVDLAADLDKKASKLDISYKILTEALELSLVSNKDKVAVYTNLIQGVSDKKYIGIKNENLKAFGELFEMDKEALKYIPDSINFDAFEELFTEEELKEIGMRYFEIINTELTEDKFTVEEGVKVTSAGKDYKAKKINITLQNKDIYAILCNVLKEFRDDEVILNSYKKVVDIELPIDELKTSIDELVTNLEQSIEMEEDINRTIIIYIYISNGSAVKYELSALADDIEIGIVSYEALFTEKGAKIITTTTTLSDSEYSPDESQIVTLEVENTATSQKVISTTETKYTNVPETVYSAYEDSKSEYTYEIKNFSDKGYEDNIVVKQAGKDFLKFESKVKFDEDVKIDELTDLNTTFLNDMTQEEIMGLVMSISGNSDDSNFMEPSDDYTSSEVLPEEDFEVNTIPENVISDEIPPSNTLNTIEDYFKENTVTPNLVVTPEKSVVEEELESAVNTCVAEALKTEYNLIDYLNVDNLKMLCTNVSNVVETESVEGRITFEVTDLDGKVYLFTVNHEGDECLSTSTQY